MNPTEIYKYKPQLKRTEYNYSYSQIVGLPGSLKNNSNIKEKKRGKKMFFFHNKESKDDKSRNQKKLNSLNNINYTSYYKLGNNMKTFEYEAPTITHKNIKDLKKTIKQ